jgi:hypothetical protein
MQFKDAWKVGAEKVPSFTLKILNLKLKAEFEAPNSVEPLLPIPETADQVIVHHACSLHEGVTNRRSDKAKSAALQVFAHGIGLGGSRWNVAQSSPLIHLGLACDKLPDVAVEAAELFLHSEERFRVADCGRDLQLVANNPGIGQQLCDLLLIEARDAARIKTAECTAIVLAFIENRVPAQPGLSAFEDEKLKERPIIVNRDTPFFIVIPDREFVRRPSTTGARLLNAWFRGHASNQKIAPSAGCSQRRGHGESQKILERLRIGLVHGRFLIE